MFTKNVIDSIGNTPLVRVEPSPTRGLVLAKLEYLNPGGSVKDRPARYMIEQAEKTGALKPGGTIIEASSGNQGIALALIGAVKGYRVIITVPAKTSEEKVATLRAYGAEVIVCPMATTLNDPQSYHPRAEQIHKEIEGSFMPNQYYNKSNAQAHYETTGPEIWEQSEGLLTHLFIGMGSCGTMNGVARYIKEQNPKVQVIGVDAAGSTLSNPKPFAYAIEGIGVDVLDGNYDASFIDHIIPVTDEDAFALTRTLGKTYGLFGGLGSGAVMHAINQYADHLDENSVAVTIFGDSGRAYLNKIFTK
jgi:cystathionine beta-synthase